MVLVVCYFWELERLFMIKMVFFVSVLMRFLLCFSIVHDLVDDCLGLMKMSGNEHAKMKISVKIIQEQV